MRYSDFSSPEFHADPYPFYERLRAAGPLVNLGPGVFVSGRYDVVDHVLRDRRLGRAFMQGIRARYDEERSCAYVFAAFERMLIFMNPPEHTRLRALLMDRFSARQMGDLRVVVERLAGELIGRIDSEGPVDVVGQFAWPLPIAVICHLLDVPPGAAARLAADLDATLLAFELAPMSDAQLDTANEAMRSIVGYFSGLIAERRPNAGSDLISLLLAPGDEGIGLTDDEVLANVLLLFVAGHETTANMIGNALIALHRHPDELRRLVENRSLIPRAVNECLRYDTSVQMITRAALEDVEIHGVALKRGDVVFVSLGSANRDPEHYSDPDRLRLDRPERETRLVAFGGGIHYCLGARLAAIELETALRVWLDRMPRHRLHELERPAWRSRNALRGVRALDASPPMCPDSVG